MPPSHSALPLPTIWQPHSLATPSYVHPIYKTHREKITPPARRRTTRRTHGFIQIQFGNHHMTCPHAQSLAPPRAVVIVIPTSPSTRSRILRRVMKPCQAQSLTHTTAVPFPTIALREKYYGMILFHKSDTKRQKSSDWVTERTHPCGTGNNTGRVFSVPPIVHLWGGGLPELARSAILKRCGTNSHSINSP